jgi:hypothetical protein
MKEAVGRLLTEFRIYAAWSKSGHIAVDPHNERAEAEGHAAPDSFKKITGVSLLLSRKRKTE